MNGAFSPSPAGTVVLSATSASGTATLAGLTDGPVAVTNLGPNKAFIRFGGSSVTAVVPGSAGDYPVLAGTTQILDRGSSTTVAAICATGETATLYFSSGQGS